MNINKFWLRTMGILGTLGGITLFAGDMLFYYDSQSIDHVLNMSNVSDNRIIASGITALIAAWLYILGLGQVAFAFKPTSATIRNTVVISFGAILMSYGVIHGAFVAIATSAKLAAQHNLDLSAATALATQANEAIRFIIYPIFGLLSVVFIYQVWKRNTLYPRWIILFFPLAPFLLQGVIAAITPNSLKIIILGGYLNLMLVLFFAASTIALWKKS